jgi:anhydro-N-acetylmuramic acid kinase
LRKDLRQKRENSPEKGKLLKKELQQLNKLPYYKIKGAKSLGREDLEQYLKILDSGADHKPENILHTLVVHFSQQINKILVPVPGEKTKVLVTGGGAHNKFFMEKLTESLGSILKSSKLILCSSILKKHLYLLFWVF